MEKENCNSFGDRLQSIRKSRGISREDFAKEMEITYSALSMYERNKREPKDELKIKMAKLLNVSIQYLLGLISNPLPFNDFQNKLVSEELENAIIEQQGNLLYTTLSEECSEVIQACSKITRKKFYNEEFDVDNLLEEIGDLEINLYLIKKQLSKEPTLKDKWNEEKINQEIENWQQKKFEKLNKIFLK